MFWHQLVQYFEHQTYHWKSVVAIVVWWKFFWNFLPCSNVQFLRSWLWTICNMPLSLITCCSRVVKHYTWTSRFLAGYGTYLKLFSVEVLKYHCLENVGAFDINCFVRKFLAVQVIHWCLQVRLLSTCWRWHWHGTSCDVSLAGVEKEFAHGLRGKLQRCHVMWSHMSVSLNSSLWAFSLGGHREIDIFRHVVAWPCVFLSRWFLFWYRHVPLSTRMHTHKPNPNHCKQPLWPGCSWIWTISEKRPCLDLSTLLSVGLQDLEAIPKWFLWVAIFIFQIQNGWNELKTQFYYQQSLGWIAKMDNTYDIYATSAVCAQAFMHLWIW